MPRIIGRYWPILGNLAILANTKYWPIILTVRLFKSTLFEAGYNHEGGDSYENCCLDKRVARPSRQEAMVHFGAIASGNQVMRDARRSNLYFRIVTLR